MGARNFVLKVVLFLALFGWVVPELLWSTRLFRESWSTARAVHAAVRKSGSRIDASRTIVLGDSVANQFFPVHHDQPGYHSMTCNQAISMAGVFALLDRLAEANDLQDAKVLLLFRPDSLSNDLDGGFTFQYFVIPFYYGLGAGSFSPAVKARVEAIPSYWMARIPAVRVSMWSPPMAPGAGRSTGPVTLSPVSREYLGKVQELATARGLSVSVRAPPLPANERERSLSRLRAQITEAGLAPLFRGYFEHLIYLPDDRFADGVHLRSPGEVGLAFLGE